MRMFATDLKKVRIEFERSFSGIESALEALYRDMDQSYQQAARAYGFFCTGCKTSCCETRFYHHTLAEYSYLRKGLLLLPHSRQETILEQAGNVLDAYTCADEQQKTIRISCPLCENGQCVIYSYRPMICRLHGIPHEFETHPGKSVHGPGCHMFTQQCADKGYITFDRTPFYRQLAALEQGLRKSVGVYDKFKMTIAEMLILERDISP